VHDLTFVRHPDLVSEETRRFAPVLVQSAIDRGATVHVVSDFVGDEVRDHYALDTHRVVRVYPGIAQVGGGDPAIGRALAGSDAYVLALGQIEPRKNLPRLVHAFDAIAEANRAVRLVIAGPDGWGRGELDAAMQTARYGDRVHWLGYVSDADRRSLLAGARVFAYPSLYEGYGHPPLEAMAAGTPVVAADSGAIPEILGDAAILVDPLDVAALADALHALVSEDTLRATLVERGRARAAAFGWDAAVDAFVGLYEQVADAGSSRTP